MAVDAAAATGSACGPSGRGLAGRGRQRRELTDARTPTAHQATHQSGGSDALTGNLDAVARANILKAGTLSAPAAA
jgi:hypothetical protein